MLGAIIGDVVGSIYEFHNIKTKDFPLFLNNNTFTDDTILTAATAEWLLTNGNAKEIFLKWGRCYQSRTLEEGKIPAFGKGFMAMRKTQKMVLNPRQSIMFPMRPRRSNARRERRDRFRGDPSSRDGRLRRCSRAGSCSGA